MKNNIKEEWKEVEEFPNYLVSNTGKIYSKFFKRKMSIREKKGYSIVRFSSEDKIYERTLSRVVAIAFIPNPDNKKEVNHIDEIKSNNHISNLEWMTPKENVNHGTRNERVSKILGTRIEQLDFKGNIIREYDSISQTQNYGFSFSQVAKVCRGLYTHHKGFKWRYKE